MLKTIYHVFIVQNHARGADPSRYILRSFQGIEKVQYLKLYEKNNDRNIISQQMEHQEKPHG